MQPEISQINRRSDKSKSAGSNEQFEKYTSEIYEGLKNQQQQTNNKLSNTAQ